MTTVMTIKNNTKVDQLLDELLKGYQKPGLKGSEPFTPLSVSGERTMLRQIDNWGLRPEQVRPITYDALGNVYYGFR